MPYPAETSSGNPLPPMAYLLASTPFRQVAYSNRFSVILSQDGPQAFRQNPSESMCLTSLVFKCSPVSHIKWELTKWAATNMNSRAA
jgi:hypothetical protein